MSAVPDALGWIGSSKKDYDDFPEAVQDAIGYALYRAQLGHKDSSAKPLKGFGGASVLEVIDNFDGDTYRAIYTVRFEGIVYVLHSFKKKSKSGISTPKHEIELVGVRLKAAELEYLKWKLKRLQ